AIVWASTHRRREISIGGPTVFAIWGNKIASGLFDRYLAATGYEAQQTDRPVDPNRQDNLWHPLPGDHGAHGRLGARRSGRSVQAWMNEHAVLTTAGVLAGIALAALAGRGLSHHPTV